MACPYKRSKGRQRRWRQHPPDHKDRGPKALPTTPGLNHILAEAKDATKTVRGESQRRYDEPEPPRYLLPIPKRTLISKPNPIGAVAVKKSRR